MASAHTYSIPTPLQNKDCYTMEDIYREYQPLLLKLNRYKTETMEDAEDLTHEIFLRVILYTKSNPVPLKSVPTFLSRHATFAYIDWMRKYIRGGVDLRSYEEMFSPSADYNHPVSKTRDPLMQLLIEEASLCMHEKLKELSLLDYKLFHLVYWEGIKTIDAAKEVEITKGNADVRLYRIRKFLSSCSTKSEILEA